MNIFSEPMIVTIIASYLSPRDAVALFSTNRMTYELLVHYEVNRVVHIYKITKVRGKNRCIFKNLYTTNILLLELYNPHVLTINDPLRRNYISNNTNSTNLVQLQSMNNLKRLHITVPDVLRNVSGKDFLPAGLEKLYLEYQNGIICNLPPKLIKLIICNCSMLLIDTFPSTLRELDFDDVIYGREQIHPTRFEKYQKLLNEFRGNIIFDKEYWRDESNVNIKNQNNCNLALVPNHIVNLKSDYIPKLTNYPVGLRSLTFTRVLSEETYFPDQINVLKLTTPYSNSLRYLPKIVYPRSLTELYISGYNIKTPLDNLPSTLEILHIISCDWHHPYPLINIPPNLKKLVLGRAFNHSIYGLPDSITHLELGRDFNQPITKLPASLNYFLLRSFEFCQMLKIFSPLRNLKLLGTFNQQLDGCLPESLAYLTLGTKFSQPIVKLPNSLLVLKFKGNYPHSLRSVLPKSLNALYINGKLVPHQQFYKS